MIGVPSAYRYERVTQHLLSRSQASPVRSSQGVVQVGRKVTIANPFVVGTTCSLSVSRANETPNPNQSTAAPTKQLAVPRPKLWVFPPPPGKHTLSNYGGGKDSWAAGKSLRIPGLPGAAARSSAIKRRKPPPAKQWRLFLLRAGRSNLCAARIGRSVPGAFTQHLHSTNTKPQ